MDYIPEKRAISSGWILIRSQVMNRQAIALRWLFPPPLTMDAPV